MEPERGNTHILLVGASFDVGGLIGVLERDFQQRGWQVSFTRAPDIPGAANVLGDLKAVDLIILMNEERLPEAEFVTCCEEIGVIAAGHEKAPWLIINNPDLARHRPIFLRKNVRVEMGPIVNIVHKRREDQKVCT